MAVSWTSTFVGPGLVALTGLALASVAALGEDALLGAGAGCAELSALTVARAAVTGAPAGDLDGPLTPALGGPPFVHATVVLSARARVTADPRLETRHVTGRLLEAYGTAAHGRLW
jgi:hypothetical protein